MSEQRSGGDRRHVARRAGDREQQLRDEAQLREHPFWKRAAIVAVACWAVVATVGVIALIVALGQRDQALNRATAATKDAAAATRRAADAARQSGQAHALGVAALASLQAEAAGLCAAIDQNRAYVDDAHQTLHSLLRGQGALQLRTGVQLEHGISRAVHRAGSLQVRLGSQTLRGARHIRYLAPIDCQALTANPRSYVGPRPVPFGSPGAPR